MEIKCSYTELRDFFEIQKNSKNPLRLQDNYAEILCFYKDKQRWVKVDFEDLEAVSKIRWKLDFKGNYIMVTASLNGKTLILSRFLINPKEEADHINGDTLDNRKSNLRDVTHNENCINRKHTNKFRGVHFCKSREKWVSMIRSKGKTYNLGRFDSQIQAAKAYDNAALKYHGEFARLNFGN